MLMMVTNELESGDLFIFTRVKLVTIDSERREKKIKFILLSFEIVDSAKIEASFLQETILLPMIICTVLLAKATAPFCTETGRSSKKVNVAKSSGRICSTYSRFSLTSSRFIVLKSGFQLPLGSNEVFHLTFELRRRWVRSLNELIEDMDVFIRDLFDSGTLEFL